MLAILDFFFKYSFECVHQSSNLEKKVWFNEAISRMKKILHILKPLVEDSSLQLNWAQSDFTIILFDVLEEVIEDWVGEPHGKVVVAVGHGWEAE